MRTALAMLLALAVVLSASRTRRRSWRRQAFLALLLVLDGLMLAEVCGAAGPRTAAAAVLLAAVMFMPLLAFVYWWAAVDRADAFGRFPVEAAAWWLSLDEPAQDETTPGGPGDDTAAAPGSPSGGTKPK